MHIHDPIHGPIEVSAAERRIIDAPEVQRLRLVRQLGFAEAAFPGATHSRLAHSIGTLAVATRLIDAVFARTAPASARERARLRQAVRLAALLHDVGHPPFSHASESGLPPLEQLGLPAWLTEGRGQGAQLGLPVGPGAEGPRRAGHEDVALAMLTAGEFGALIDDAFADGGVDALSVAGLIAGRTPPGGSPFVADGVDWAPLLQLLVSSELDADRMDYLFRDSVYTGVNYGKFDLDWIVRNVDAVVRDGAAWPALDRRAVFAFEDFLLSRHHMFMSVYFHRTSIGYEQMLARWYREAEDAFRLPADPAAWRDCDDVALWSALRASSSPWARRIVERRPYRAVWEEQPGEAARWAEIRDRLHSEGVDATVVFSRGEVSKYLGRRRGIFVRAGREVVPVEHYARVLTRHAEAATLVRVYVPPEALPRAEAVVDAVC